MARYAATAPPASETLSKHTMRRSRRPDPRISCHASIRPRSAIPSQTPNPPTGGGGTSTRRSGRAGVRSEEELTPRGCRAGSLPPSDRRRSGHDLPYSKSCRRRRGRSGATGTRINCLPQTYGSLSPRSRGHALHSPSLRPRPQTTALLRWPKPGRGGPTRSDAYQITRASSVNASASRAEGGTSVPRS